MKSSGNSGNSEKISLAKNREIFFYLLKVTLSKNGTSFCNMDDDARLLERAVSSAKSCLLPPLPFDFDSQQLSPESFKDFRMMLADNLHLLLDILFHNRTFLERKAEAADKRLTELREKVLLLTYEQTEGPEMLKCEQESLIQSLDKLTQQNFKNFDHYELRRVIETYKENLTNDGWKKHLGLIHGFPRFCKDFLTLKKELVNSDQMLFMLSVGSKLVEHYDPQYKTIGLKIHHHLARFGAEDLLREFNIQQVIYSECSSLIRKCDELPFNDLLYDCLLRILKMEEADVNNSKWCKFDCIFGQLLDHFATQSDPKLSLLLVEKIVLFCVLPYGFSDVNLEATEQTYFDALKKACRSENLRTMRWTKKLMEMIGRELPKLTGNDKAKYLNAFHSIYIASFANTEKSILGRPLTDFTKKLTRHLLIIAKEFRSDRTFLNSLQSLLSTTAQHQSDEKFQLGLALVLRSFD